MSSSSIGAWPHHSDSRCPRISASSARRSVYSTSGVSETWIDATAISTNLLVLKVASLRGANGSRECAPDDKLRDEAIHSCWTMDCFAALAMTVSNLRKSHMPDFIRHVVKCRMTVDLG